MKTIIISFFGIILFWGCSNQKNIVLFNGGNLQGVAVETNNFNYGEIPGLFIASESKSKVTYKSEVGVWDLSKYVFINCEVENLSDQVQLVELMINGDKWPMGAVYLEPGDKKIVKSVIMRQTPSKKETSQFPNMNGYPGGSLHLWWKSYVPDSIKTISLYLPLSKNGDKIKFGKVFASVELKEFSDEEYKALLPIVDEFGQYIHKDFPGKIRSNEDLIKADGKEVADLNANPGDSDTDKFGGWKNGPQLEATGHFRVEKYNGVWAIVDPDGYLFWSHGIDCVTPSSDTPVEGRERLFSYIPDVAGDFSDFVRSGRVGTAYTPVSAGSVNNNTIRFVNLYGMNLKRKWGDDYRTKFNERAIKRLKSWRMNTIANWSDAAVYNQGEIPYTINANTAMGRMLADPFNPTFQGQIENQITGRNSKAIDDPYCLGIFIDNEIRWGNESLLGTNVLTTENYPFAKKALVDTLMKKYNNIAALNKVWDSNFSSWNELAKNNDNFEGASDDIKMMSGMFASEYFKKCRAAVKKIAPDMLYLGSRFDFHLFPDVDLNGRDWVIPYGGKYADIVSFNRYNYSCNEMKPIENMDFPIIIGEFHVGALDRGLPHSGLRHTNDQKERALVYKNFLMQAVKNPYIVGVGWFQYLDQPYTGRNDGENYQIGFVTVGDYPNQEIVESAREVGQNMYKERYGSK